MIEFIYSITGLLSLFISVAGIVYIVYFAFKSGFKLGGIVGLFLLVCISSYLVKEPDKLSVIGENIFKMFWKG